MKVITFWTFDLIHPGHIYYLSESKKHWDILITIVWLDKTVKKVKWKYPMNNEITRLNNIKNLALSDYVQLWNNKNPYKVLLDFKPDIICFWYDQISFTNWVEEFIKKNELNTKIIIIDSYFPEKFKSSLL
jgi:FAD synthetase